MNCLVFGRSKQKRQKSQKAKSKSNKTKASQSSSVKNSGGKKKPLAKSKPTMFSCNNCASAGSVNSTLLNMDATVHSVSSSDRLLDATSTVKHRHRQVNSGLSHSSRQEDEPNKEQQKEDADDDEEANLIEYEYECEYENTKTARNSQAYAPNNDGTIQEIEYAFEESKVKVQNFTCEYQDYYYLKDGESNPVSLLK